MLNPRLINGVLVSLTLLTLNVSPVAAEMQPIARLHSDLHQAMCAQDWDEAIVIATQMLSHPRLSREYRHHLRPLVQQFEAFRRSDEAVYMAGCGFAGNELNWESSINAMRRQAGSSGSSNSPYTFEAFRFGGMRSGEGGGGSRGGGGGSGGGNCNTPGDTAADGSRCGGRAASERAGGR
jgi:hypothetical protein